jgi:nucleotide-binding universal stress UspA family protein
MIPEIKKILYATDLTKNSRYAFYFAADLAKKHNAKITILHCIASVSPHIYWEGGIGIEGIMEKAKRQEKESDIAEIKKYLEDFCRKVESEIGPPCVDLVSDVIVKVGYPTEEILNMADEKGCDVIVIGTHGKGWLKQQFLGSIARSVLERTRKPSLLVPLPPQSESTDWGTL